MLVQPALYPLFDGDQTVAQVGVRRGADDSDAEHRQRPARDPLDDTDAAAGQSRVDSQYAHACPSPRDVVVVMAAIFE